MTLVEFLRARLDERRERIERLKVERWQLEGGHIFGATSADEIAWVGDRDQLGAYLVDCSPDVALAEVDAKRRIVDRHSPEECVVWGAICRGCGYEGPNDDPRYPINECPELRDLALPYADHPDYDPSWRP